MSFLYYAIEANQHDDDDDDDDDDDNNNISTIKHQKS